MLVRLSFKLSSCLAGLSLQQPFFGHDTTPPCNASKLVTVDKKVSPREKGASMGRSGMPTGSAAVIFNYDELHVLDVAGWPKS